MFDYWMRYVAFSKLRDLLVLIADSPGQLRPRELDRVAIQENIFVSQDCRAFGPSTCYHYRRAIEKLGMVGKPDGKYLPLLETKEMNRLNSNSGFSELSVGVKYVFGNRIVTNSDCFEVFWGLFTGQNKPTTLRQFVEMGSPISMNIDPSLTIGEAERTLYFRRVGDNKKSATRTGYNAIQAIHYGMRDWAVNQLGFLDNFYRGPEGYVLFPVKIEADPEDNVVARTLIEYLSFDGDWAKPHVTDLLFSVAAQLKIPMDSVRSVLLDWIKTYPEFIAPVPISERTILSGWDKGIHPFVLKGFLTLENGKHISHLSIHRGLLERVYHASQYGGVR